ncbi:hypothetical protein CGLO_18268 [Colletotrichum gloeosporioides Cg-14]|uniref:Uncharacterized protein n=1 Tax=Colletotrichum gloeosporioides (strain Cg-14) TaxID=1237896 RepID=T0JRX1_COLGC|nr:hypothetical protein CGLO_18268 [Colletotrichum gloeosporioides Cg-14]
MPFMKESGLLESEDFIKR